MARLEIILLNALLSPFLLCQNGEVLETSIFAYRFWTWKQPARDVGCPNDKRVNLTPSTSISHDDIAHLPFLLKAELENCCNRTNATGMGEPLCSVLCEQPCFLEAKQTLHLLERW